jgi:hypothetical protein
MNAEPSLRGVFGAAHADLGCQAGTVHDMSARLAQAKSHSLPVTPISMLTASKPARVQPKWLGGAEASFVLT